MEKIISLKISSRRKKIYLKIYQRTETVTAKLNKKARQNENSKNIQKSKKIINHK